MLECNRYMYCTRWYGVVHAIFTVRQTRKGKASQIFNQVSTVRSVRTRMSPREQRSRMAGIIIIVVQALWCRQRRAKYSMHSTRAIPACTSTTAGYIFIVVWHRHGQRRRPRLQSSTCILYCKAQHITAQHMSAKHAWTGKSDDYNTVVNSNAEKALKTGGPQPD